MAIFQIRTSGDRVLHHIIQDMVDEAVGQIQELGCGYLEKPEDIGDTFRRKLAPFIKAFNTCGTFPACSDEVEGGPWLNYHDHIYMLETPDTLKTFFKKLASDLVKDMESTGNVKDAERVVMKLEIAIQRGLLPYLYYNPICGKHGLCKTRLPINPWFA